MPASAALPTTRPEWQAALKALPATPDNIPAFFFGHGSPMLAFPEEPDNGRGFGPAEAVMKHFGPGSSLAHFLTDFGPTLLEKYKPKGIVVFSAHWETRGERLVTDYGDENPLLMDYYGFDRPLYQLKFSSKGDSAIAKRVVDLFKEAGMPARLTPKEEPRGRDGRTGFPGPGLDHGVFVPFRLMFGETFRDIPVIQASIEESLSPETNWAIGQAVKQLRKEGILVLAGGVTVHNLRDFASFSPDTARENQRAFSDAVTNAMAVAHPQARKEAMMNLKNHPGFRASHPREEHLVPIYVAAGAGDDGDVRVLSALFGSQTVAFGL
ncbi:Extradiol ring-cleavage dioxygenase class III enzyme subunit B [Dentipellis sp. KUC8613]|nr:Extradiol ring-cleavage dioxygenase class III enzyme subunit B [Dentipellis sp. KUC8613]